MGVDRAGDLAYKQDGIGVSGIVAASIQSVTTRERSTFMKPLLNFDSTSILRSQFPNDRARHLVEGPRSSMSHFEGKIERALGRS